MLPARGNRTARPPKQGNVLPGVLLHFAADQTAQCENHGVRDLVVDGSAEAAAPDEVVVVEDGQVLGNIGLFDGAEAHQFGDRKGAVMEGLQDGKAVWLGKHGEEARDGLEVGRGKYFFFRV